MTGEQSGPGPHPDVRALLAAAGREPAPLPDDVAARLDATLADLVAERGAAAPTAAPTGDPTAGHGGGGDVVPLAAGPRETLPPGRRWGSRLLAAAAAVAVVGGVGLGLHAVGGQGTSSVTAGSGGQALSTESGAQASGSARTPAPGQPRALAGSALPRLSTLHFRRDAVALVDARARRTTATFDAAAGSAPSPQSATSDSRKVTHSTAKRTPECRRPDVPRSSELVPARVDGRRATLALVDLTGGRTRVSAYACSGTRVLARATVDR